MPPHKLPLWATLIGSNLGLGLLFIGGRFRLLPTQAESSFGLTTTRSPSLLPVVGMRVMLSAAQPVASADSWANGSGLAASQVFFAPPLNFPRSCFGY